MSENNIARGLQKKFPDIGYQMILNMVRKAKGTAAILKRESPDRKFNDILREETEKIIREKF